MSTPPAAPPREAKAAPGCCCWVGPPPGRTLELEPFVWKLEPFGEYWVEGLVYLEEREIVIY